ncbi:hypothetical protein V5O48_012011, partial [Marasmius crinis-equi]
MSTHSWPAPASPPPTLSRSNSVQSAPFTPPSTPIPPDTKPTRPLIHLDANSTINHSIHGLQENRNQFNHGGSGNEYLSNAAVSNTDDDGDAGNTIRDSPSSAEHKEPTDDFGRWTNAQFNGEVRGVQLNANQYNTDARSSRYHSSSASDIDGYKEWMSGSSPIPGTNEGSTSSLNECQEFLSAFTPTPNAQINMRIVGVQQNQNQYNTRTFRSQYRSGST